MNILVTNDDGIFSEGIYCLKHWLKKAGHNVIVCAPDTERSAVGHGITLRVPIWLRQVKREGEFFGWSTSGTPADCVKLGALELSKQKIDLVISGINRGSNIGTDVPYSGTVSGALEGAILGYPSIAISSVNHQEPFYDTAGMFISDFLDKLDLKLIKPFGALNINVPSKEYLLIKGYKITKQSSRRFNDYYEKRLDPYGNEYYWLKGSILEEEPAEDSDYDAIINDYVSITPLTVFMWDEQSYKKMKEVL